MTNKQILNSIEKEVICKLKKQIIKDFGLDNWSELNKHEIYRLYKEDTIKYQDETIKFFAKLYDKNPHNLNMMLVYSETDIEQEAINEVRKEKAKQNILNKLSLTV